MQLSSDSEDIYLNTASNKLLYTLLFYIHVVSKQQKQNTFANIPVLFKIIISFLFSIEVTIVMKYFNDINVNNKCCSNVDTRDVKKQKQI